VAQNVLVATGFFHEFVIPVFAASLPIDITMENLKKVQDFPYLSLELES
jgi:hypothetical protein